MKINIKGNIILNPASCSGIFDKFKISILGKSVGFKTVIYDDISLDENGAFETTIEDEDLKRSIYLEVKIIEADGSATTIKEYGPYCNQKDISIQYVFNPREHLIWYDYVSAQIQNVIGDGDLNQVESDQYELLACQACISIGDIKELLQAGKWRDEVMRIAEHCIDESRKNNSKVKEDKEYHAKRIEALMWLNSFRNLKEALFAFALNNYGESLSTILLLDNKAMLNFLEEANQSKRTNLPPTSIYSIMLGLSFIRNCILFNAKYDNDLYDAKLIFLSANSEWSKYALFDRTLELGSLSQALDETEFQAKKVRKSSSRKFNEKRFNTSSRNVKIPLYLDKEEIIQIMSWDVMLGKFPPLLSPITIKLRKSTWDPTSMLKTTLEEWKNIIGSNESERKYPYRYDKVESPEEQYATDIYNRLLKRFPTKALEIALKNSKVPGKTKLIAKLSKAEGFDINKTAISRYYKVGDNPNNPNEVSLSDYKKLQEFQRTIKLAGGINNMPVVEALYAAEYTSSASIIQGGQHQFELVMEGYAILPVIVHKIYCRARANWTLLTEVATTYIRLESDASLLPPSMITEHQSTPNSALRTAGIPDLEGLFGSMDSCNCKHCQSVYSPAAYLTDLLHWMTSDVVCRATNRSAFQELDARRPDIKYIQLNCKNSNTVLPYIDLVNELLLAFIKSPADITLLKKLQTTKSSEELILRPEHLDHTEFDYGKGKLRKAHYSWSLPYDLDWDRSNYYVEALGINSHKIGRSLGLKRDNKLWISARLGLVHYQTTASSAIQYPDWDLMVMSSVPSNLWTKYYGVSSGISTAREFMDSTSLSFDDLNALSQIGFIVQGSGFAVDQGDHCDLNAITLVNFNEDVAFRLMKFVKLSLRTGLSFAELDFMTNRLGLTAIDQNALTSLAQILDLAEKSNEAVLQLLSIIGEIPIHDSTLSNAEINQNYQSRFLSNLQKESIFHPERLNLSHNLGDLTSAEKEVIANQFGLELTDLDLVLGSWTNWDVNTVSYLSKIDILLRLSELGFEDFWYSLEMEYSSNISTIVTTQDVYDFIDKCTELRGFEAGLRAHFEMMSGTESWEIDMGSYDISSICGDDLTDAYQQFSDEMNVTPAPATFETLVAHISALLPLDQPVVEAILTNANISILWNLDELFIKCYRLVKRVGAINSFVGLDLASFYTDGSHTHAQLQDNYKWLIEDYSASNLDAVRSIHWIAKIIRQASDFGIDQGEFLQKANDLRGMSSVTLSNIENFAEDTFDIISNTESIRNSDKSEFKDMMIRAYSVVRDLDLDLLIDHILIQIDFKGKLNLSVVDTWNLVFKNQPFTGIHGKNALSLSAGKLQDALDEVFDDVAAVTKVEDKIRISLRDRLLQYHLTNSPLNFENSNAVYAYYLLDPEMDACMKTSRIKLALSGSQLLLHRGMMGLEPNLCPSQDNVREWEWRQNYRVWEANRKVFLYPENWVDPTLRIEKSELYEQLEDTILQDEVTTENCEKAVSQYLLGLNKIARLDIRAFETKIEEVDGGNVLHVFGRTFTSPYEYYYRRREVNNKWTPWEKLELDIEGDHIIPAFFNRKLYLIWPMFIEKEHRKIKRFIDGEEQNAPYYEVKLCYSKLEFGKWSSKRVFDATLLAGHYGGLGCYNRIDYKLGQGVPMGIVDYEEEQIVIFPPFPFPPIIHTKSNPIIGSLETDNGSLVLSNPVFQDYAKVSLDKEAFYFWPQEVDGDLIIHVRRDFHKDWDNKHYAYSEMAYEDSFRISACDESAEIIRPIITENSDTDKRFLARPYRTLPLANRMVEGLDNKKKHDDEEGMYVKKQFTHGPGSVEILGSANSPFYLTYPVKEKHSMSHLPFFSTDKRHTLFFERKTTTVCRKKWVRDYEGNFPWIYTAEYDDVISNRYTVEAHEHPYVCLMLAEFNKKGFKGLYQSNVAELDRQQGNENYFAAQYNPRSTWIEPDYPIKTFDFDFLGSYSIYNMEVFFHAPTLVARQLKSNGKFADAIKWLQFIFDPTNRDMSLGQRRYWMVKPFFENVSNSSIQNLMALLGAAALSPAQERERQSLKAQIEEWEDNPFEPHRIAEMRLRTYMLYTVYEYIDVLIQWGDSLFAQDTMESINEATNLYILASELLGRRPLKLDKPETTISTSYDDIRNGLDDFSNTIINLENEIPGYDPSVCCKDDWLQIGNQSLPNLLFCIPDNPKILEMWDEVEDRLFKIRHCMNIQGQVRELALFQPPIDPALLVRARAMGIDIGDVIAGLNAPDPIYRFSYMIQKANEYVNEVKSLSGQLLSALEKKDAEELSQIRQLHEGNMLKATRSIKKLQLEEAKNGLKSLAHSKKLIEIRLDEYSGKEYMNSREKLSMTLNVASEVLMYKEKETMLVGKIVGLIPDIQAGLAAAVVTGGKTATKVTDMIATAFGVGASILRAGSSLASTYGGYDRRQEDWDFQVKTAKEELKQMDKQILGAEIRVAIAQKELDNHDLQMEQSAEIYDYLKYKFTNEKLYAWMSTELSGLCYQAFKLANDVAMQAQRAYEKELGDNPGIVLPGNWDSAKKGLLSGEKLSLQLKTLDDAYMKNNTRKYEMKKSLSLRLLDPQALLNLIENRYCKVALDSQLFQLDFHGKTLADIKIMNFAVSIPSVTGPYVSTNLKLRYSGEEIITSSGVNDPAVFDTNPAQPKYLPFEYEVIDGSELEIMLPNTIEYDESTISDVVLHFSFTAKDMGNESISNLNSPANEKYLMMSWRHDFPLEWQSMIQFVQNNLTLPLVPTLSLDRVPYKYKKGSNLNVTHFDKVFVAYDLEEPIFISSGVVSLDAQNNLLIDGKKLDDIWLLYEMQ